MNREEIAEQGKILSEDLKRDIEWGALTPISLQELEEVVKKWLLIADDGVVKVICATVVANKLKANPIWLFLVAPSGGGKTDFIRALNKIPDIYPLSTLTTQTFISGQRGEDTSLLPQLSGKIITFKDFTTILQSHPQVQSELLAQLREIYDGEYKKDFGTGARKGWKGKIGFIAGVTSIIDRYHNVHKSLGERFLQYRIVQPDRYAVMDRIENNALLKNEMDEEMAVAFASFVKGVDIPEKIPPIPEDIKTKMRKVAGFVSVARSAVIRDPYSKQIEFVPDKEMTTRIYGQMFVVAIALMVINKDGSLGEGDYRIIFKLGFDSIHYLRRKVLEMLREYKGWVKTETIATRTDYSTPTIRNYIEELVVLGIAERKKPSSNMIIWRLRPEYRDIWKDSEFTASEASEGMITDDVADDLSLKDEAPPEEDSDSGQLEFEPPSLI